MLDQRWCLNKRQTSNGPFQLTPQVTIIRVPLMHRQGRSQFGAQKTISIRPGIRIFSAAAAKLQAIIVNRIPFGSQTFAKMSQQQFLEALEMAVGDQASIKRTLEFIREHGALHRFPMYKYMSAEFKEWWEEFWASYKKCKKLLDKYDEEMAQLTEEERQKLEIGQEMMDIAQRRTKKMEERRAAEAQAEQEMQLVLRQGGRLAEQAIEVFQAANEQSAEAEAFYAGNAIVQYTQHEAPAGWEEEQPQQGESRKRRHRHHKRH